MKTHPSPFLRTLLIPLSLTCLAMTTDGADSVEKQSRAEIRTQVTKEFERLMGVHEARIEKLEKEVTKLRVSLNKRRKSAEEHIDKRVEAVRRQLVLRFSDN